MYAVCIPVSVNVPWPPSVRLSIMISQHSSTNLQSYPRVSPPLVKHTSSSRLQSPRSSSSSLGCFTHCLTSDQSSQAGRASPPAANKEPLLLPSAAGLQPASRCNSLSCLLEPFYPQLNRLLRGYTLPAKTSVYPREFQASTGRYPDHTRLGPSFLGLSPAPFVSDLKLSI